MQTSEANERDIQIMSVTAGLWHGIKMSEAEFQQAAADVLDEVAPRG